MKRYSSFLALLFLFTSYTHTNTQQFTPKNTVFVWDIHEVVLQKNWPILLFFATRMPILQFNFHFLKRASALLLQLASGSEVTTDQFIYPATYAGNHKLARIIINMANAQKPIPGTMKIIKKLKSQGYTHYIASNIGKKTFNSLIDPKESPYLSSIFLDNFDLKHPQTVHYDHTKADDAVVRKPNPLFYQQLMKNNKLDPEKQHIIFIDDKLKNVKAARKLGFIGIHFINSEQLARELNTLGILKKASVDKKLSPAV